MRRDEIADLAAFVVVAEERSFTKAAHRLGMAQSALSQIVRRIEDRVGVRLLSRTTRSVAPMIAVRIGPDTPMAIVGSPDYFQGRPVPASPAQLIDHRAINLRLPTSGTLNGWRLMRGGRETRVRIDGSLVLNTIDLILDAALEGLGLAYLPLDRVQPHLDAGRLTRVLARFTPDLPGYHLYYPHRRHASAAFALFVETL